MKSKNSKENKKDYAKPTLRRLKLSFNDPKMTKWGKERKTIFGITGCVL